MRKAPPVGPRGAALKATRPIDTSTAAGKAFLDMLGVFAEFETNLRRERQMEGIAKAKAAGVYKGRKPTIEREAIEAVREQGFGATAIAKRLGIGRASLASTASWRAETSPTVPRQSSSRSASGPQARTCRGDVAARSTSTP